MKKQRSTQLPRYSMLAFALLAGCAGGPAAPIKAPPDPQLQQFAAKGYMSNEQFSLNTQPMSWTVGGRSLDFLLSVPVRPERYPLIIYLPGLGESRTSGEVWRNAWAQAGYAVLSIQLLLDDAQAWETQDARAGEFRAVARQRYSSVATEERLAALRVLIAELRKHGDEPGFKNIDLGRIVLAGYDIGAYTAMVAAGEKLPNSKAPPLGEAVAGVIALSPFADFSGVPFETRYAGITAPVLSITGRGDVDNYGWVPSEALRQAPFKHMPPGSKALLLLEDCSHELLGGNPLVSQVVETSIKRENPDADTPRRGDRGEGPGRRRTSVPGMAVEQSAPTGPWAFARSAVSAVTTAYLDAEIKKDSFAKEWLGRDSRRWLRETATLTVK